MPRYIDLAELEKMLNDTSNREALYRQVVDAPFTMKVEMALMFLGIVVLLLVDKKSGVINRVALSQTDLAEGTKKMSSIPFEDIKIPVDQPENVIAITIKSGKPHVTTDWKYLFTPALSAEHARLNQAGGGIAYSCVYPLTVNDGGALIFSYFQFEGKFKPEQRQFMRAYTDMVDTRLKMVQV